MKRKKYLIISDAASVHIYNYVRQNLEGRDYDIYILRHSVRQIPAQYAKYYEEHNITVFSPGPESEGAGKAATIKRFLRKLRYLCSLGTIDVVHIHYLHRSSLLLYRIFRYRIKKLILSYWGDDVLIPMEKEVKAQKKCLPYADAITVTVQHSKDVFQNRFGQSYNDRLHVVHFPNGGVCIIRDLLKKMSKLDCRRFFDIPDGKICIVCGYSSDEDQKQDICMEEISLLSDEIKKHIHVILPMQYGAGNQNYKNRVLEMAQKSGCSYQILTEYVPHEVNAKLCIATDVYINVRKSDASSNFMKEELYAGAVMIQGDWLIYKELENAGERIVKIQKMNEIHEVLEKMVPKIDLNAANKPFEYIYETWGPEYTKIEWDTFLTRLEI